MASNNDNDDIDTAYEDQERPVSRTGRTRSLWRMMFAAIFLIAIVGWLLLRPYSPEPAGEGPLPGAGGITRPTQP